MEFTRRQFAWMLGMAGTGALAFGGLVGLAGCGTMGASSSGTSGGSSSEMAQRSFFAFDTMCAVGGSLDTGLLDWAQTRCEWFEEKLSATVEGSDVSRINAAAGAPVEVEPETADLIGKSLRYSEESGGLFDITIGAVSSLWDFKEGVVPTPEAIAAALPHIDYRNVQVEGDTVRLLDPMARIDLGGIAKGYIADELIAHFREAGESSAFVNLGGNVKVLGAKEDGTPWSIGVRDPEAGSSAVVARVSSEGGSLVTSGLYERRFERDGRAFWHILDPRTGYPAESGIVSASIYSAESIDGDGYTKPLFMMREDDALSFLESHNLDAFLIRLDGITLATPNSPFAK